MIARRGVTMMEAVIGTLLVGGVLAGTLGVVGPTARSSRLAGDVVIASYLAAEMLAEIEAQAFEDPDSADRAFGPEPGESGGNRSRFDDVDDYLAWSSAPQSTAGALTAGLSDGWLVSVGVVYANAGNPNADAAADTGIKRVTVSVTKNEVLLHQQSVLRTRGFDSAWEE
ncbi:MAG: hypothetical protein AAGA55_02155 [Planctomycetota bacterium]